MLKALTMLMLMTASAYGQTTLPAPTIGQIAISPDGAVPQGWADCSLTDAAPKCNLVAAPYLHYGQTPPVVVIALPASGSIDDLNAYLANPTTPPAKKAPPAKKK